MPPSPGSSIPPRRTQRVFRQDDGESAKSARPSHVPEGCRAGRAGQDRRSLATQRGDGEAPSSTTRATSIARDEECRPWQIYRALGSVRGPVAGSTARSRVDGEEDGDEGEDDQSAPARRRRSPRRHRTAPKERGSSRRRNVRAFRESAKRRETIARGRDEESAASPRRRPATEQPPAGDGDAMKNELDASSMDDLEGGADRHPIPSRSARPPEAAVVLRRRRRPPSSCAR